MVSPKKKCIKEIRIFIDSIDDPQVGVRYYTGKSRCKPNKSFKIIYFLSYIKNMVHKLDKISTELSEVRIMLEKLMRIFSLPNNNTNNNNATTTKDT